MPLPLPNTHSWTHIQFKRRGETGQCAGAGDTRREAMTGQTSRKGEEGEKNETVDKKRATNCHPEKWMHQGKRERERELGGPGRQCPQCPLSASAAAAQSFQSNLINFRSLSHHHHHHHHHCHHHHLSSSDLCFRFSINF